MNQSLDSEKLRNSIIDVPNIKININKKLIPAIKLRNKLIPLNDLPLSNSPLKALPAIYGRTKHRPIHTGKITNVVTSLRIGSISTISISMVCVNYPKASFFLKT